MIRGSMDPVHILMDPVHGRLDFCRSLVSGRSAGSFPEQRLVIEPRSTEGVHVLYFPPGAGQKTPEIFVYASSNEK